MRFRVLGPVEYFDGLRWHGVSSAKQRSLLAYLLLHADRSVATDRLVEELWDYQPPRSATNLVHQYVLRLRRTLGDQPVGLLVTRPDGYKLSLAGTTALDCRRFTELINEAQLARRGGDAGRAAARLGEALALWRGRALADVRPTPAIEAEAARLEELRLTAIEERIDAELDCGRAPTLVAELRTLVREHPMRERLWRELILALYRAGRQADALTAYREVWQLLDAELAVEPGPELRRLHQQILRADPALAVPPSVPATGGNHQRPAPVPRQLPADVSNFAGRTAELAALYRLLPAEVTDPPTPVLVSVITGTAGAGKTALAVHAAHRMVDHFPDGQMFLDLHGFTKAVGPVEPADALDRLLRALAVPGEQIPAELDDRAGLWRSVLVGRRMLIVLDNAATEEQVVPLLPGVPGCLVLVTTRRSLPGLEATHTLTLDMLPAAEAVALFACAAGRPELASQSPELVGEAVELCGRLPLAIRIAAARLRTHPAWAVGDLVARLHDQEQRLAELDDGSRSVTIAFELSYQQLPADQQRLYRLLGLHPGPDLDPYAAAALADTTIARVKRLLDRLLDAHLLQEPVPGRYVFHDLVRAHAAGTAADDEPVPGRRAALSRLLDHYRHTASMAMDLLYPYEREHRPRVPPAATPAPDLSDPTLAIAWLDTELANLLATARHGAHDGSPEHTVHLSAILRRHLRARGFYRYAEAFHHLALTTARVSGNRNGELAALIGLGHIHRVQGRYAQATDHFTHSLQLTRTSGNRNGELEALIGLGHIHRVQGRNAQGADHFADSLQLARTSGNRNGELEALIGLGDVYRVQGRNAQGTDYFAQVLEVARASGNRSGKLDMLLSLGWAHMVQGLYGRSVDHFRRALEVARTSGNRGGELTATLGLGQVWHAQATDCYQQVLDLAGKIGSRQGLFEALHGLGRIHCATGHPDRALAHHHQALELATELGQPSGQARAHGGLADAYRLLNRYEPARRHWQYTLDILTSLGIDHTEDEEASVSRIRDRLAELDQQPEPQPGRSDQLSG